MNNMYEIIYTPRIHDEVSIARFGTQEHAQKYLEKFYNNLGFKTTGESYLEDGIPHIAMVKV